MINISSIFGLHGNPGQAKYAIEKADIVGSTKTIAKELGRAFGDRGNTVAFGYITTRLTTAKEAGAGAVLSGETKVALDIPMVQQMARNGGGGNATKYPDIPLGRLGDGGGGSGGSGCHSSG